MDIFESIVDRLSARGVTSQHLAKYLNKAKVNTGDLVNLYEEFISDKENWIVPMQRRSAKDTRKLQSREMPFHFADILAKRVCDKLNIPFREISRRKKSGIRETTVNKMVGSLKKSAKGKKLEF